MPALNDKDVDDVADLLECIRAIAEFELSVMVSLRLWKEGLVEPKPPTATQDFHPLRHDVCFSCRAET